VLPLEGFWETRGLKGPPRRLGSDSPRRLGSDSGDRANFDLSCEMEDRKEEKLGSPNG